MEVTGRVKFIGETETFGSNGFRKRTIAIVTNEQYPQTLGIDFIQDNVALPDQLQLNQEATISVNLQGREWTNPQGEVKYFNSLVGWRIVPVQMPQQVQQPQQPAPNFAPPTQTQPAPTPAPNFAQTKQPVQQQQQTPQEPDLPF